MKDRSWEKFGQDNPYFAVCTQPQYKTENLDSESLKDFFSSGEEHVSDILQSLRNRFGLGTNHSFNHVLDFGCGTGRLLIPFSKCSNRVVGIDISQPMLDEARKNLEINNINDVELIQSSDVRTLNYPQCFDLVHTYIVLQHIPQEKGIVLLTNLFRWFVKVVMVLYILHSQIVSPHLRIRFIPSKTAISGYVNLVFFYKANQ